MKTIHNSYLFVMSLILLSLYGCGGNISNVKNGYLDGYNSTTVGNAFDVAFYEPKWEEIESPNKSKYVQFTGRSKGNMLLVDNGQWTQIIPSASTVVVKFAIKNDESFDINSIKSTIMTDHYANDPYDYVIGPRKFQRPNFSFEKSHKKEFLDSVYKIGDAR